MTASSLEKQFVELYGQEPQAIVFAPGRVNLLGEHTDYNDGLCLPMALMQRANIALRINDLSKVRISSCQEPGSVERQELDKPQGHWSDTVVGVVTTLRRAGHQVETVDCLIDSDVPVGAGVSSSAAICVAMLRGMNQLYDLGLDAVQIAKLAQVVENEFLGLSVGLMDQMASSVGEPGKVLLFDTQDDSTRALELPEGTSVIVINSGVKRRLVGSEYNDRRASCEAAARTLGVKSLRLASLDAVTSQLADVELKRARHVVTENLRVEAAVKAIASGDMQSLGQLMNQGHQSLSQDFEVSVPEVDALVATCQSSGALGARITGAGFGGCVVVLTTPDRAQAVLDAALAHEGTSLVAQIDS